MSKLSINVFLLLYFTQEEQKWLLSLHVDTTTVSHKYLCKFYKQVLFFIYTSPVFAPIVSHEPHI